MAAPAAAPVQAPEDTTPVWSLFEKKMKDKGLSSAAIDAFKMNYEQLVAGVTGLVPESKIEPVEDLPRLNALPPPTPPTCPPCCPAQRY